MAPLVSVVVPCYKFGHLLSQCVNSVLAQDYANVEILIMDNCSPDETPRIAQSFKDPRVKYIRNETNLGHVGNFNRGLTLASGKYVSVLPADDMLRNPHLLRRYVEVMEQNPHVGFSYCRAVELHDGKETGIAQWTDAGEQDRIWDKASFLPRLSDYNCIAMSSVLIRKECLKTTGPFQLDLPFATDWHMWCTLALHFQVAYFAEPMVCCRFHEASLTSQYYQDHTRICIGDELAVLWRVGRNAEAAGMAAPRDVCYKAFVRRAVRLLKAALEGAKPVMSACEFEDILLDRIKEEDGVREMRASVYGGLAEHISTLLLEESGCIPIAAEIGVLWDLRCRGELVGVPSLRNACDALIAHRAVHLLREGPKGTPPAMSGADFEAILQSTIGDVDAVKEMSASVYTNLADEQYSSGDYAQAARSYRLGLSARPGRLKTWTKYLLLQTGTIGIRIRPRSN